METKIEADGEKELSSSGREGPRKDKRALCGEKIEKYRPRTLLSLCLSPPFSSLGFSSCC